MKKFISLIYFILLPVMPCSAEVIAQDCISKTKTSHTNKIECDAKYQVNTEEERNYLSKKSYGIAVKVNCDIRLSFSLKDVRSQISGDSKVTLGPLPVTCDLETLSGPLHYDISIVSQISFNDKRIANGFELKALTLKNSSPQSEQLVYRYVADNKFIGISVIDLYNKRFRKLIDNK